MERKIDLLDIPNMYREYFKNIITFNRKWESIIPTDSNLELILCEIKCPFSLTEMSTLANTLGIGNVAFPGEQKGSGDKPKSIPIFKQKRPKLLSNLKITI
jgi:hypothetical protein